MVLRKSRFVIRLLNDSVLDVVRCPDSYSFDVLYGLLCHVSNLLDDLVFSFDHDGCSLEFE